MTKRLIIGAALAGSLFAIQPGFAQGVVIDGAARRDGDAYRRRRSWRWGDQVTVRL